MNQLFKLEHELRLEKNDLDHEKVEVQVELCNVPICVIQYYAGPWDGSQTASSENAGNAERFVARDKCVTHDPLQFVEVKKLEHDIGDLRGSVDNMVKKVTDLTGGKGEGTTRGQLERSLVQPSWLFCYMLSVSEGRVKNVFYLM